MATVSATKGIKTAFSGGADVFECVFNPAARRGVQIEAEGFTLNGATITAFGVSSTEGDVVVVSEAKKIVTVGSDLGLIGKVTISGVTAGSYQLTAIEI